jgi:CRP-like cAMP-binding protein
MSIATMDTRVVVAIRLLKQFWLFEGLSDQDLARIARVASFRSMERGEALIDYGGSSRSVYCVLGGMVKLLIKTERRKERIVELVGAGRTFGEGLVFLDQPSPSRAVAVDDGRLLVVPGGTLIEMLERSPALARRWLRSVSQRACGLLLELQADAAQSAAQRIVSWLLAQTGSQTGETHIRLQLSKATLAASLNTTPETLSRVLKHLRQRQIVRVKGREIVVLDTASLRAMDPRFFGNRADALVSDEIPDRAPEWARLAEAPPDCEVPHWFERCECAADMPHWCDAAPALSR